MIGNGYVSKSTGVWGWHSSLEEDELIRLARLVPDNGIIVELGGEYGRSAAEFLYATRGKNILVYTVDIFPPDHYLVGDLLKAQQSNLIESGVEYNRHIPIKSKSFDAGMNWQNGEIDLLFIDAAHDYASVKADIEAWQNHIRSNGFMMLHDMWKGAQSHPVHIEVKRAVDEWHDKTQWQRFDAPDSLVYFIKPENAPNIEASTDFELPYNVTISEITGVPGWLTKNEENELIRLATEFLPSQGNCIVELGAGLGRSTSAFIHACRNKSKMEIISVDLFDQGSFSKRFPYSQLEKWLSNVRCFIKREKLDFSIENNEYFPSTSLASNKVFYWQKNTQDKGAFKDNSVALLFIDADHDYASVKADIAAWIKSVKRQGIVIFHDYDLTSVKQAVDEWHNESKWIRHESVDSLIYFVRPFEVEELPFTDPEFEDNPESMTINELSDYLGYPVSSLRGVLKDVEPIGKRGKAYLYNLKSVQRIMKN